MKYAKPIFAVASVMAGAVAAGVAIYIQQNPLAFTNSESETLAPAELTVKTLPPEQDAEIVQPEPGTMPMWAPVQPVRSEPKRAKPPLRATTLKPCSEWFDMAQGPVGRHVRLLCEVPADAPVPNS